MDRDDARFVADALDSRISGDREALDRLASTSFVRLVGLAARVRSLAANWPPALVAACELETIAKYGSTAEAPGAPSNLIIFVDKMRELVANPARAPRNRAERRAGAAKLPREARRQSVAAIIGGRELPLGAEN